MLIYSGSELKEHIAELKKEAMAQTGLDKVYERDFVDSIRKYCFGGKSPFVYVVCGFRAAGKKVIFTRVDCDALQNYRQSDESYNRL